MYQKSEKHVECWGWYSIAVNILLTALNLIIAALSGSLAVAAEMVHNIVDLISSISVLAGLKIARRKSKRFPYGLYKVENLVSTGIAILIFLTAFEIIKMAVFGEQKTISVTPVILSGVALSVIIPYVFSIFQLKIGRQAQSPALIADAKEYKVHVLSSGLVFVSLAGHFFSLSLDRIAAVAVAVFIAKTGWELLVDGMRVLLDASIDEATLKKIRDIIKSDKRVIAIEHLTGRNAGRYKFVEAELTLRYTQIADTHAVLKKLETEIRQEIPNIDRIIIYVKPRDIKRLKYAIPLKTIDGVISEHFGEAPYFALITVNKEKKNIEEHINIKNSFIEVNKAKGIKVAEWLLEFNIDIVVVSEPLEGRGPQYVFNSAGVEMIQRSAKTVTELLTGYGYKEE